MELDEIDILLLSLTGGGSKGISSAGQVMKAVGDVGACAWPEELLSPVRSSSTSREIGFLSIFMTHE